MPRLDSRNATRSCVCHDGDQHTGQRGQRAAPGPSRAHRPDLRGLPGRVLAGARQATVPRGVRPRAHRTAAGSAALVPAEYGGGGLGSPTPRYPRGDQPPAGATPAPATPRCTRWAPCCGTARRSRSSVPARHRQRRAAPAGLRRHGARRGLEHARHPHARRAPGRRHVVNGQKIWTSRFQHSDLMLLLARTDARPDRSAGEGLSMFLVDLREAGGAHRAPGRSAR